MELGVGDAEDAIQLPRAEVPLELQKNFTGLRNVPLFYAQYCRKLNHKNKVQNRVLLATLDHVYVCHPNGDILRCFPFSFVEKIYHDPERKQVGIVVPKEYDLLVALFDTFHFIHVVHTLRSLHTADTPLVVELVKRSKQRSRSQVPLRDNDSSAPAGSLPTSGSLGPPPTPAAGSAQQRQRAAADAAGHRTQSFFQKLVSKFIYRPPPGVIIGWNDAFLDADDDGSGESVVGSPNEVCLGKGYYALRLEKPLGFVLSLHNVSTEGI